MNALRGLLQGHLISRVGDVAWPAQSPTLLPTQQLWTLESERKQSTYQLFHNGQLKVNQITR